MVFNSRDGCYDRIAPSLSEIAIRQIGCPTEIAKTLITSLTATQISMGFIQYSSKVKIIMRNGIIELLTGLIGVTG